MKPGASIVLAGTLAAVLAAAAIAAACYRGSGPVFIFFNACFFALVALALPQPRLYVYTFLAAFLVLGFWVKVVFHAIWDPGFVEPVGDFSYSPREWDSALIVAVCGALGVVAARLAHLWWARRSRRQDHVASTAPRWFIRWAGPVWVLTIVLLIGVNAANLHFAFYQIGVKPRLLLPMRGHVLIAWLVNIGFALWVASLVWWDYRSRRTLGRNLLLPVGESLLSATSAFSRMNFLLHALPYALAILERRKELLAAIRRRSLYVLLGLFLLLFVVSVIVVFWLRVYQYYGYASGTGSEPLAGHVERTIYKQVPLLLIHRWVGLEGILAVGAKPGRSPKLLADAIVESPKLEGQSLFQRTAKTRYLSEAEQFVFLGNAGPIAVLWFSGSPALVLLGRAAVGLILIATEEAARRWTGNPFVCAVSGAALANVVVQTTFFYLTLVFLLQLWVAMAFLAALQRLDFGNSLK